MDTDDELIQQNMTQNVNGFKINFRGNIEYLGVSLGTEKYINNTMMELINKLKTKLYHIELINDRQMRTTLFRKFFNYNKIIYALKNVLI